MKRTQQPPAELDEKALHAVNAGSDGAYVLTQAEHGATAKHKPFAIVDRSHLNIWPSTPG